MTVPKLGKWGFSKLRRAFRAPVGTVAAVLWFSWGGANSATGTILAVRNPAAGLAFLISAALLFAIAIALLRSQLWAMVASLLILVPQPVTVLQAIDELVRGITSREAAGLAALGIDPRPWVALNLAYSLIASVVFIAVLWRSRRSD
jgi:hypothetical protein